MSMSRKFEDLCMYFVHFNLFMLKWDFLVSRTVPEGSMVPQDSEPYGGMASCNLYVSGLPHNYADYNVSCLFGEYGPIYSLVVLRDSNFSASRGTALVQFHKPTDAMNAMHALHGYVIPGSDRPLEVRCDASVIDASHERHFHVLCSVMNATSYQIRLSSYCVYVFLFVVTGIRERCIIFAASMFIGAC